MTINFGRPDSILCCRISAVLKGRIGEFRAKNLLKTETEAIIRLIEIALFVESKREDLQDPDICKFLQQNLYNQELVDWIYALPADRLEALFSTFRDARLWRSNTRLRGFDAQKK